MAAIEEYSREDLAFLFRVKRTQHDEERTKLVQLRYKIEDEINRERKKIAEEEATRLRQEEQKNNPDGWFRFHFVVCDQCLEIRKVNYKNEPCPSRSCVPCKRNRWTNERVKELELERKGIIKKADALLNDLEDTRKKMHELEKQKAAATGRKYCERHEEIYEIKKTHLGRFGYKHEDVGCLKCFQEEEDRSYWM